MAEFSWSRVFNAETKQRWLNDYESSHSLGNTLLTIRSLLMKLAPYEYEKGEDFCRWDDSEFINSVICKITPTTSNSRRRQLSILRGYVRWCLDHHIPGTSSAVFSASEKEDAPDNIGRRSVTNPKQLAAFLDNVFGTETRLCEDLLRKCYAWLAFSGIPHGKASDVRKGDVYLDKMEIVYKNASYRLYYESLDVIRVARNATEYERYVGTHWSSFPRTKGYEILRGMSPEITQEYREVLLRSGFANRVRAALQEGRTNKRLTYMDIYRSGVFYRMYEDEVAGFPVDFASMPGLFGSEGADAGCIKQVIDLYRSDYENWKSTIR